MCKSIRFSSFYGGLKDKDFPLNKNPFIIAVIKLGNYTKKYIDGVILNSKWIYVR